MYHVDVTNTGDSKFKVASADGEFAVDTKGGGMTPPDTLLASIGSCIGVYVKKYCEGARLPIAGFAIRVDADFTKEPPLRFKDIKVSIDLKGVAIDDRRKKAMLEFIKNCPVHNTIKNNPDFAIGIL
ncbi:MAG: OsmC family protein [Candidatus Omnitrophica bacterium]|nr:OsmC family protein [Candidatus Omnitrophota bacterium]